MIITHNGEIYCEQGCVTLLFCEKRRKIFDERSEKTNNDIFGMANK